LEDAMKNKIEIKYVSGTNPDFLTMTSDHWEMTVWSDIVGKQVIQLETDQAMVVALAIGIAKETGKKEGYEKAKKKYKAITKLANLNIPITPQVNFPWDDADKPQYWNPKWKLNDPRK
jgi:hypothetical protein